jgi:tetratricopeptide (TPR) repeat protein
MRNSIVAAVVLAVFLTLHLGAAQQAGPVPARALATSATVGTQTDSDLLSARILTARKDYAGAADIYERLARENPRDPSYPNFAGIAHMQEADLEGARKLFERATKINKRFSDGYNNLGTVWFSMKDYKRAIRQYEKAVALQPNMAPYYTNLGYAYFNRNKLPEAMDMFHKALALDPGVFEATGRDGPILQDRSISDHGLFNFTMAKSYAQLGDAMHCAVFLRRAFEEGYKEMAKARSDPAFTQVLASSDVQTVLDEADPLPASLPATLPETPSATPPNAPKT